MKKINLSESFEKYDFSINKVISGLAGIDDAEAKKIQMSMKWDHYFNFIMAVERDAMDEAKDILANYIKSDEVSVESVAQEMHYLAKENVDCVLTPEFMKLNEKDLIFVLEEMNHSQTQKILANLRGFKTPGYSEMSATQTDMNEQIRSLLVSGSHRLMEVGLAPGLAPGQGNQAQAYGMEDTEEKDKEEEEEARQEMNTSQDSEILDNEKDIEELKRLANIK